MVPRFTNVPTYDVQPHIFASTVLVTGASSYKKKNTVEKGGEFRLLTVGGKEAVALSPQQSEIVCFGWPCKVLLSTF